MLRNNKRHEKYKALTTYLKRERNEETENSKIPFENTHRTM